MPQPSITLYIPGLFAAAAEPAQLTALLKELPFDDLMALELLLARAQQQRGEHSGIEQTLFTLFGIPAAAGDWPVAAVTRLIDGGTADGHYWLRADPVHMQPSHDQVIMAGNQQLNVSGAEMAQLRDEFNQLCRDDGLQLETPVNQRWYLRVERAPQITTIPLPMVVGQNIYPHLPQGVEGLYWNKLLSEVQMLFYGSSVNQRRRQQGLPEINSLWFWGGGQLPAVNSITTPWQQLWSNELLSRGLARLTQIKTSSLPATGEEWLEQATVAGHHLVVLDGMRQRYNQPEELIQWHGVVQELNQSWFVPLLAALKSGDLSEISLISDGHHFQLNRKQLGRWWQRRRPFSRYL